MVNTLLFQFHKGTIRTFVLVVLLQILSRFNSIKVRLEPEALDKVQYEKVAFQFHKGTIRTPTG